MTDLADFLLARIAEDEERGRSLVAQWSDVGNACQSCGTNGARVLAECDSKRRIVEAHPQDVDHGRFCGADGELSPCPTLRLLALPYAAHPDYRQEWKP